MENAVIKNYQSYNQRRYGKPWVATIKNGEYDFSKKVGTYTANNGDSGDLVVYEPEENVVYAYGQKDYRGGNTTVSYARWDGKKFVDTDKIGRVLGN